MSDVPTPTSSAAAYLRDDEAFDAIYPAEIRDVSSRFWTPLEVARRAATLLHEAGVRAVLDVGSGVGKFALVAGATLPELGVVGIEQRRHLVAHANHARETLALRNVRFVHGDATAVPWRAYDGLYFYNSFAENLFDPDDQLDAHAELSMARFARDVQRASAALRAASVGTSVATFYGSSGRVPTSYVLEHQEQARSGWLRLWTKRDTSDDGSFFVEEGEWVVRHDASGRPL